MKKEIDNSQEKQKRNRQPAQKAPTKSSNPANLPVFELPPRVETKTEQMVSAVNKPVGNLPVAEEKSKEKVEIKIDLQSIREDKRGNEGEERKEDRHVIEFKVDTEEREVDMLKNPESPRPAPPVFDENLEAEAAYNKLERKAKEKEAMEHAQKAAFEQKLKVQQELGDKKNEMNKLEDKYENIAAKYMNK